MNKNLLYPSDASSEDPACSMFILKLFARGVITTEESAQFQEEVRFQESLTQVQESIARLQELFLSIKSRPSSVIKPAPIPSQKNSLFPKATRSVEEDLNEKTLIMAADAETIKELVANHAQDRGVHPLTILAELKRKFSFKQYKLLRQQDFRPICEFLTKPPKQLPNREGVNCGLKESEDSNFLPVTNNQGNDYHLNP